MRRLAMVPLQRLTVTLFLCQLAATTLAQAQDAGPTDAYSDATLIHEDWYTGLICENWQNATHESYVQTWGVDAGDGTLPPEAAARLTDDEEVRNCGVARWHTVPHGLRTHHNLTRVKVPIHQDNPNILSVKVCIGYWENNDFKDECTGPKTTAVIGSTSVEFDWDDFVDLRDDIASDVVTFLYVSVAYSCHRFDSGVCDPDDLAQIHGAYFRWRNDNATN